MLDAFLAWIHFVFVFAFSACLIAEAIFYARTISPQTLARLSRVDITYGILTVFVIASGIAHAIYSPKTGAYYLHDSIFWTKMALFVAIGLLSIAPTVHLVRLREPSQTFTVPVTIDDRTYRTMRLCMTCELVLLAFIPLCAAFMARGFGYA